METQEAVPLLTLGEAAMELDRALPPRTVTRRGKEVAADTPYTFMILREAAHAPDR